MISSFINRADHSRRGATFFIPTCLAHLAI
jgi:hypothetical protein